MSSSSTGTSSGNAEVRWITADEFQAWAGTVRTGTHRPPGRGHSRLDRLPFVPGRFQGAFDGDECVGAFRSARTELAVPGGGLVAADVIADVAVLPTHRRRGLLTRMMDRELRAASGRGEPLALLVAAEPTVYGRFGFGPATRLTGYRVDVLRAGGVRLPAAATTGRLKLLPRPRAAAVGPGLYERFRRGRPGAPARPPQWWTDDTGTLWHPLRDGPDPLHVGYHDAAGRLQGLLTYRVDPRWDGNLPAAELTVLDLITTHPDAAAALWDYCLSVDWVTTVLAENLAPDDPLPLLLGNPRAARPGGLDSDFAWLRVLDLPAALAARRYSGPGRLVLEVDDPAGYAHGRFALESAPDGTAHCSPAPHESADLALGVGALGSLYLGEQTPARLHAAGLVAELRPGAVLAAELLLHTATRPWCTDGV
ncbi:GNAT family N-acetyltransferase [Kitasatospora indigofera]|uniref:GNAT family N-acetyltransferase n=1 Tax=Kitasatospora indigofera TaxID=67307 RepID=UPI0033ADBE5D